MTDFPPGSASFSDPFSNTGPTGSGTSAVASSGALVPAGRIPPQAMQVEQAVLGALLIEREAIPKTIEILPADSRLTSHFSGDVNRMLIRAQRELEIDVRTDFEIG